MKFTPLHATSGQAGEHASAASRPPPPPQSVHRTHPVRCIVTTFRMTLIRVAKISPTTRSRTQQTQLPFVTTTAS